MLPLHIVDIWASSNTYTNTQRQQTTGNAD